jgi:hypothetical protein
MSDLDVSDLDLLSNSAAEKSVPGIHGPNDDKLSSPIFFCLGLFSGSDEALGFPRSLFWLPLGPGLAPVAASPCCGFEMKIAGFVLTTPNLIMKDLSNGVVAVTRLACTSAMAKIAAGMPL